MQSQKFFRCFIVLAVLIPLAAACGPTPEPQVIRETALITQEIPVEITKEVPVEVTKVVEKVITTTPEPSPTVPAGPVMGGSVTIARDQEPDKLVLMWTPLAVSFEVANMVNDSLIRYNEVGEFVPFLASEVPSIENGGISEDGTTYTFHLRDDVTWHDGQPFTAEDVSFTFDVLNDPDSGVRKALPTESVETPDDHTVVVKLEAPRADLLAELAMNVSILPRHALKDVGEWQTAEYLTRPWPGTGAFQFSEWEAGSHIILEKNPDYYQGEPYLDQVIYRVMPNDDARLTALATGEVDMSFFLIGEHVSLAQTIPGVKVYETPAYSSFFFTFNLRDPILQDVRTRRALTHAVDKQGIVETVVGGLGSVKWVPLSLPPWVYIETEHKYPYDPDAGMVLLEEVGWVDTDGDGIREAKGVEGVAEGTKLAGTILNIAGQPERQQVCEIVQQQLEDVGASMEIETVEISAFLQAGSAGEFAMAYMYLGYSPEPAQADWWWRSDQMNWHGIETVYPDIDALLDRAAQSLDRDERKALYGEFQEMIAEGATDLFMYDRVYYDAVKEGIQNFVPIPGGGVHTWNAFEWWISP